MRHSPGARLRWHAGTAALCTALAVAGPAAAGNAYGPGVDDAVAAAAFSGSAAWTGTSWS